LRPEAPWPNAKSKGARLPPRALRVCPADPKVCPERLSPSGGSSLACRCAARVAPTCAPSRGFGAPWSVVCRRIAGALGSPLPPRPRVFTLALAVSLRPPSAPSFDEVSSSCELSASCRVLQPARCPSRLVEPCDPTEQPKSASHGVLVPHRDVSRRRPPFRRESRPSGHVPSSTFLTSSTVSSATCLRGLVSSRCHVQGLPFRGLSLAAEPYRVSPATSCPLAVERSRL